MRKRRLLVGGVDCGERLSESTWALLDLLAEMRPRDFTKSTDSDGILSRNHRIGTGILARNGRREFQRQLPPGVSAKSLIQTVRGKGYRLRAGVRIHGRSEAGLLPYDPATLAELDKRRAEPPEENDPDAEAPDAQ